MLKVITRNLLLLISNGIHLLEEHVVQVIGTLNKESNGYESLLSSSSCSHLSSDGDGLPTIFLEPVVGEIVQ